MKVLKFGGTSVADAHSIKLVADIVKNTHQVYGGKLVIVVSAMGGATNQLLTMANLAEQGDETSLQLLREIEERCFAIVHGLFPSTAQSEIVATTKKYLNELEDLLQGILLLRDVSPRTKDKILSYGELISSKIIASYMKQHMQSVEWLDSRLLIKTDSTFGDAVVDKRASYENIQKEIATHPHIQIFIAPGFISSNELGETTTIGRGGSDYSASLYAVALNATMLEIWTDVSGMMTADPRLVKHAKYIEELDYATALELCHFGAKIIFPPTLEPVMQVNTPILLKNTFAPQDRGTLISEKVESKRSANKYTGISSIGEVAILNMRGNGVIKLTSIVHRTFKMLSDAQIPVLLTTQGSSEHYISIAISMQHIFQAVKIVEKEFEEDIAQKKIASLKVETDLSLIALVGNNMRNQPGIAARMFSALGRNAINIRAMAQGASERNISTIIERKDIKKANLTLHEEFFEEQFKMLHLFIVGVGNVGSKLLQQIQSQKDALKESLGLRLKVIGIANSKNMLFNEDGIDLASWKEQLEASKDLMQIDAFIQNISKLNMRNSIFVDITADGDVALTYDRLLQQSVSVVACNKIACSVEYDYYKKIKLLSRIHNASLMFETNVGAALPIIDTLNGLIKSGDEVERIEAVLSGTLNFVFNNYDATQPFSQVVKQAKEEGYTEPDPRIDLSGKDVARKILILAREAGKVLDITDVEIRDFLPKEVMDVPLAELYQALDKHESTFKKIYEEAKAKNCRLKYIAKYANGKASIGLELVDPASDMYHLYNKDNIVVFYTKRYKEQPLVVKGAGAGAEVTASGIFADILKTRY